MVSTASCESSTHCSLTVTVSRSSSPSVRGHHDIDLQSSMGVRRVSLLCLYVASKICDGFRSGLGRAVSIGLETLGNPDSAYGFRCALKRGSHMCEYLHCTATCCVLSALSWKCSVVLVLYIVYFVVVLSTCTVDKMSCCVLVLDLECFIY